MSLSLHSALPHDSSLLCVCVCVRWPRPQRQHLHPGGRLQQHLETQGVRHEVDLRWGGPSVSAKWQMMLYDLPGGYWFTRDVTWRPPITNPMCAVARGCGLCLHFMTLISALTGLSLQKQAGHCCSVDEKIKSLFKPTCFHLVRLISPGIQEVHKTPNQPSKVEKERWLTGGGHWLFIIARKKCYYLEIIVMS